MKKLTRDESNGVLWGVCAGLAKYFEIDVSIVRLLAILTLFLGWVVPPIVVYLIAVLVIPSE